MKATRRGGVGQICYIQKIALTNDAADECGEDV